MRGDGEAGSGFGGGAVAMGDWIVGLDARDGSGVSAGFLGDGWGRRFGGDFFGDIGFVFVLDWFLIWCCCWTCCAGLRSTRALDRASGGGRLC